MQTVEIPKSNVERLEKVVELKKSYDALLKKRGEQRQAKRSRVVRKNERLLQKESENRTKIR
jgi:hypothetical protein